MHEHEKDEEDAEEEDTATEEKRRDDVLKTEVLEKALRQKNSYGYTHAHKHGDLKQLPEKNSPYSSKWTNSVAICAIAKNENMADVREWIMYHRCDSCLDSKSI